MIKRGLVWSGLAALVGLFAAAGYWLLFTVFMGYDDEGYVLLSLRHYAQHGALYDRVFSQYGPFFFAAYDALHRVLGFAWTNTNGRWLTLVLWSVTALFAALAVKRHSRSAGAAAFTYGAVFTFLWIMIHEPTHPGGLIGLLVAVAAWIGVVADPAEKPAAAAAIGAVAAAMALTKINVGVFMFASAGTWLVVSARDSRIRRIGAWGLAACLALRPWALMHAMLNQVWVREYAIVFLLGSLGVLVVLQFNPKPAAGWRVAAAAIAGAAGVTILTVVVSLARGSSWLGLLDGVVLGPLRQPVVYHFAFIWRTGTLATSVAGLAVVLAAWRWPRSLMIDLLVAAVRLLAFGVLVLSALQWVNVSEPAFAMTYGVGLAALCALPLRRDAEGLADARVRQWLAIVLVLQFLHAYPVAGSQLNWGTFLWVPLLILAVRDAWLALPPWVWCRRVAVVASVAGFGIAGVMGAKLLRVGLANRHFGEALGLPGAEKIVIPDDTVFALRIMAQNARAHADMLFSLSGLYSFNLWTGLPTPTLADATQWFESLSAAQQQAIIDRLRADPRPALIVQLDLLRFLVQNGFRVRGPLGNYLAHEFHPAFSVDGYAFWVPLGHEIAPLSTGSVAPLPGAPDGHRLELVLAAPVAPVARIELWAIGEDARKHLLTLTAADASLDVTPLHEDGKPSGATDHLTWPGNLPSGIIRLGVDFHRPLPPAKKVLALLFAPDGKRIAAARILP